MATVDTYRPADERALTLMYRRVFGPQAADHHRLRWDWQYRRNPNCPPGGPQIWVAHEGPTVIGQYATMPVRLAVNGQELAASWGMGLMVTPERQRQGVGEMLVRTWDQHVGASLGLGLPDSSRRLFEKLRWPSLGSVPCLSKPLTRRAVRRPNWPMPINRFLSAVTLPFVRMIAREKPLAADVSTIRRFDDEFTMLWERLAPKFAFAVRRDAAYLNWKFIEPPHVRYTVAALRRAGALQGYAVYRHVWEPQNRVTLLIDFLADPDDEPGMVTLLRFVDRVAHDANSDKIRAYCLHQRFQKALKHSGYFNVSSAMSYTAKINAVEVPADFYQHTARWHLTLGDSDQDH